MYIASALALEHAVQADLITRIAQVNSATDEAQLDAISEDFSSHVPADVTVMGALEVVD